MTVQRKKEISIQGVRQQDSEHLQQEHPLSLGTEHSYRLGFPVDSKRFQPNNASKHDSSSDHSDKTRSRVYHCNRLADD